MFKSVRTSGQSVPLPEHCDPRSDGYGRHQPVEPVFSARRALQRVFYFGSTQNLAFDRESAV
jgi:hypothetical protein